MSYAVAPVTTSFVGLGFSIAAQPSIELGHAETAESVLVCAPMAPAATPCVGLGFILGAQSSIEIDQGPAAGFISGAQSAADASQRREEPVDDDATPRPASHSRMQGMGHPSSYWDTDIIDILLAEAFTESYACEVVDEDKTPKPPSYPQMPAAPRLS